ncbi:MAG: FAD-dependent oxidoreductase [Candidatus Nanohaloarchaea archaeon]|nr:FAD-dependent oxidoreductase [Candidatus Nanohaloarchaea archaeon]
MVEKKYDVVIVGGGITGTALFYMLAEYTDVERIALVEKYSEVAAVNSHHTNNSHTLHYGDIETNYSREKAEKVKGAAEMVANYVEENGGHLFNKTKKMVLGVGEEEVKKLEERHSTIKDLFPDLYKADREDLKEIEPNVVKERDPEEDVMALVSPHGYAINYKALAESFAKKADEHDSHTDLYLGEEVLDIDKEGNYMVETEDHTLNSDAVVVSAGSHSLEFAQDLGYGEHLSVLPTQGDFWKADKALNNKVYMVQMDKLPFAAVHGDPDVVNPDQTRFGPTARVMPVLERRNLKTFIDFFKVFKPTPSTLATIFNIVADWDIFKFIMRNFVYDIPVIGKWEFMKNVRKIIPSMEMSDLEHGTGLGGLRPQIIDTEKKDMVMGEAKIVGDDIIFNMTPSPGASVCLKNAEKDAEKVVEFLDGEYSFDRDRLEEDLKT